MKEIRDFIKKAEKFLSTAKYALNLGDYDSCVSRKTGECQMVCDICGREGARIRRVPRTYGKGKELLVIENIPVVSCSHCGESYLTAETLHEIERIKLYRKSLAAERPVEIVSFATDRRFIV